MYCEVTDLELILILLHVWLVFWELQMPLEKLFLFKKKKQKEEEEKYVLYCKISFKF